MIISSVNPFQVPPGRATWQTCPLFKKKKKQKGNDASKLSGTLMKAVELWISFSSLFCLPVPATCFCFFVDGVGGVRPPEARSTQVRAAGLGYTAFPTLSG